ncbi:MAG TPA: glycosyltransferase family 87 protein [Candidatus Methylomirabilis sp.]|nr:glycosyltransferase family 87 protein [Candidatus Methylomirabilis sp.]
MNEPVLLAALVVYLSLYVLLVYRAHFSRVNWLWSLACLAPAVYISWAIFGAAHDMNLIMELVEAARRGTSPWEVGHQFNHLPGYPILLTPMAWMSQSGSAAGIGTKVKLLNLGFLVWFGWIAGRVAFHGAVDSNWRGVLYFSCHPMLVAVVLWHVQFEMPVLALLLCSMTFWPPSERGKTFWGGVLYGLAVSVKHWPLLALPVLICGTPKKILRLGAGIVMGVSGVLGLHLVLNGHFRGFSRILSYSGMAANVGLLQAFGLPEPHGWNFVCFVVAMAAGLAIRLKGGQPAQAGMFTLLVFLLLSFRTAPQYWVWFMAFAPYCLSDRERPFWLVSGCLGTIVLLLEWGLVLGWRGDEYPHSTWQGNYPHLRDYPHLSSAALWLFDVVWRPLFLVAVIAAGLWYYEIWNALHPHSVRSCQKAGG